MPNSIQIGRFDNDIAAVTGVGTSNSGAASLTGGVNIVTTSVGQTACILPTNASGPVVVRVNTATAGLVFPPAGGSINGGTVTTGSFSVAQNKVTVFFPHPNGLDYSAVLSA